jgi:hypothetical protein
VVGGTPTAGQTAGTELLRQLAPGLVTNPTVTVTRTATITTVTIHGDSPGLRIPIVVTVEVPTERQTP